MGRGLRLLTHRVSLVLRRRGLPHDAAHRVLQLVFAPAPTLPPLLAHARWYMWWPEHAAVREAAEPVTVAQYSRRMLRLVRCLMKETNFSVRLLIVVQMLRFVQTHRACLRQMPKFEGWVRACLQNVYDYTRREQVSYPLDFLNKELLFTHWHLFAAPLQPHACVMWKCPHPRSTARYNVGLCREHLSLLSCGGSN